VSREGDFFDDVVTRFRLYRNARDLPLRGEIDKARLDAVLRGIAPSCM